VKRAVVDPSVLISAFVGSPDAGPAQLVAAWEDERFVMVVSAKLLAELDGVLSRPKFAHRTGHQRGAAYVAAFAARSEHLPDPDDDGGHVRDANDDYLVALARAATADAIISLDRDLLDAQLVDLAVMDPARFLASL
jgi:uncharacterized protein